MKLGDIIKKYENGDYNKPFKVDGHGRLAENHIFDEDLSVRENRQMVIDHNKKLEQIRRGFDDSKFNRDVQEYLVEEYGFTKKQAVLIESRHYAEEHSNMGGYFEKLDDLAGFVVEMLKA